MDELAMERATRMQNETHKAFIKSRWMPGWVDQVEYGKFGRAKVTVTLFGGMEDSLCGLQKRAKCHACLIGKHPEALGRGQQAPPRWLARGY